MLFSLEKDDGSDVISEAGTIRPQTRGERLQPSLEFVSNAFVAAQTAIIPRARLPEWRGSIYDGGVYRTDGTIVEEARHNASSNENVPARILLKTDNKFSGTFLYAGVLRNHFGHFLVESIGRLWGVERTNAKLEGIVFNPFHGRFLEIGHPNENYKEKLFIKEFFDLLKIDAPRVFPTGIWQFENLVVPGQLMMNSVYEGLEGHPILRQFLADRLTKSLGSIPENPKRCIYVSRSKVAANLNIFLQESQIENNLKRNGYEVIHPETMNLRKQLEVYRDSCKILFAEGSAGHLIALSANPLQKIGTIRRQLPTKNGSHSERKFERQIRAFGCHEAHTFACIARTLSGEELGQADIFPKSIVGILDFEKLHSQLAFAKFIDPDIWYSPSAEETEKAVRQIINEFSRLGSLNKKTLKNSIDSKLKY